MPKTMSEAAKLAISQAQKRRWKQWRLSRTRKPRTRKFVSVPTMPVPDELPIVNPPGTNGLHAELSITLHVKGSVVQLTSDEAAAVYDSLGAVLGKHGLSAT